MSTPDPMATPSAELPGNPGLSAGWVSGVPGILSPAELARMANEMFHALPDEIKQPAATAARAVLPPNSAFTGNPYAAVPDPTAPAVPGLLAELTEAPPKAFVPTPDRSIAPDARTPVPAATVPGSKPSSEQGSELGGATAS